MKNIFFAILLAFPANFISMANADEGIDDHQLRNTILTWLTEHETEFPRDVKVKGQVEASILGANQEPVGKIALYPETSLKVIQFSKEELKVKMGDITMRIPTEYTDIVAKALSKLIDGYATSNNSFPEGFSRSSLTQPNSSPSIKKSPTNNSIECQDLNSEITNFSTPELISQAFAKDPTAAEAYLKTRTVTVTGRVLKIEMQDPDRFVIGLTMTSGLKPRVVFTDDVKKPIGLTDRTLDKDENKNKDRLNLTWLISGNELMLHKEWSVDDHQHRYSSGYVPKTIMQSDAPVIGIGEETKRTIRFLRSNPNAVYFEIVK